MSNEKLLNIVNDLIATGERLSRVGLRTHQGEHTFGISHTYPADQDEYAQWDAASLHFGHLLGKPGEHWVKALSGHTFGAGGMIAKARLGTLRTIKDAIEKDLLDTEITRVLVSDEWFIREDQIIFVGRNLDAIERFSIPELAQLPSLHPDEARTQGFLPPQYDALCAARLAFQKRRMEHLRRGGIFQKLKRFFGV